MTARMKRLLGFGALGALLATVAACAWMYSAPVPLHVESHPVASGSRASTLLVLMPGRGDKAADWEAHGFVSDLRTAGLAFDVVAVDAHIGYYMKETLLQRMQTDVLEPARKQYKQIWIVGASMGGLGSLIVASRLPGMVDRIVLLSPYLGPDSLIRKIEAAGGPARWTPTDVNDPYQRIWQWLQQYSKPGAPMPPMMLGFARQEGMAPNHRLLAQMLPADRVFEVDGRHGWVAWRELWRQEWAAVARGQ